MRRFWKLGISDGRSEQTKQSLIPDQLDSFVINFFFKIIENPEAMSGTIYKAFFDVILNEGQMGYQPGKNDTGKSG